MLNLTRASINIFNLPRYARRSIAIISDLVVCIICTWLAFSIRLEQFIKINDATVLALLISMVSV